MLHRPATHTPRPAALARWLFAVAALVFAMVVVGGITRLTESGLSITEWKPISGAIPPLTHAQWLAEFDVYKRIPQYASLNRGMTLAGFQAIFFWEYLHRLLGRVIGLAFALPLLWFWWQRAISAGYGPRLIALLALGGLQGAVGWWMVTSGLFAGTEVSHIRLAVHLLLAMLLFAGLLWTAFDLRDFARDPASRPARLRLAPAIVLLALFGQLKLGALTAGLRAGYAYASWPLMGDRLFPAGGWRDDWSLIGNAIDNPIVVQFEHRWWAWIVATAAIWLAIEAKQRGVRRAWLVHLAVAAQIGLGVATLLGGVAIPIAVAHQAMAALLLAAVTVIAHRLGARPGGASRCAAAPPKLGR